MTHPRKRMKRLSVDVTEELAKAIRYACRFQAMGPTVEEWLWQRPEVQHVANERGIIRQPRPFNGQAIRKD